MGALQANIIADRHVKEPKDVKTLFRLFQASPEARDVAPSTRRQRDRAIQRALLRFGTMTLEEVERRGFRARLYDWRDTFADRPSEGQNNIRVVCTVMNWGVDRGWLRDNPAAAIKPLRKKVSRADNIWTPPQLNALLAAADPWLRDVIVVALYTGLRESDVIRIAEEMCHEGWLTISPRKTANTSGVQLQLPYFMIPELADIFFWLRSYRWKHWEPIMRRHDGLRWSERELRRQFTKAKVEAGLGDCTLRFHDLRGTLATWLYEARCTDAEVGAILGSSIATGNLRSYAARTRDLSQNAYARLAENKAPLEIPRRGSAIG